MIRLAGFADEAADGVEGQIAAVGELGWHGIELRSVDGRNVLDLDEAGFAALRSALEKAEVLVPCIGSTIANWGRSVDEELGETIALADRAARRAKALGAPMVRVMSYALDLDDHGRPLPDQRLGARAARLAAICDRLGAEGIQAVHENCLTYGGLSWRHSLELLEAVPSLRFVFDIGNPCLTPDFSKREPYPNLDPWEFWTALKPYVVHIHVKDGWRDPETGGETYVYPGEGPAQVARILEDCLGSGYSGWLSVEPHMAVVFHDASVRSPERRRREVFREYGLRLEALLKGLGAGVEDGEVVPRAAKAGEKVREAAR